MIWHWLIFFVGSAGIIYFSRHSLLERRSHGFYRIFAFEAILGLILLNVVEWFRDPFSIRQIISWVLLFTSTLLAIHGFSLLQQIGKPDDTINDATRLGIEKTTRLVTTGAYRHIRHPLYASLLIFALGAFLKHPTLPAGLLLSAAIIALYLTARQEEKENLQNFGLEYAGYMQHTKMFIPWLF
jgi:protein-S-isoprenylcysteine O-methyltransferase Ste14